MRQIGIIASGASETSARVILSEGEERKVKTEGLVLVENRNGGFIMAILRQGLGSNENLKAGGYHPGVAYARAGGKPSMAKETYDFALSVIGEVEGGIKVEEPKEDEFVVVGEAEDSVQQNKKILAPGSPVYIFDSSDDPMKLLAGKRHVHRLGYYEGQPSWQVPVDSSFIPYHIGIFGSTGAGKSFLARFQVIPLLQRAGYDVLVLDWKGRDYAPYFQPDQVLSIADIALDVKTVANYLSKKMEYFGYRYGDGTVIQALEDFIYNEEWRRLGVEEFKKKLEEHMVKALNPKNITSGKPQEDVQRFKRGFKRLKDDDVKCILGTKNPEDILKLVREKHIIVIDMKRTGKDEKLSMFLSLASYLMELMQSDLDLRLALVIDEGPQYCPFRPEGIEKDTTEMIIDLCALGRTHKLCICLLSQGIAGEIGINAAVRRNLNTQFVGKIHPLDMNEASSWLSPFNIDPKFLLSLAPGHFYFMGSMNPSPVPILLTFDIKEER